MLQPLKGLSAASSTNQQSAHSKLNFTKIKGITGLEQALAKARTNNQSVMVDFYADWCVSCKEMEAYTFTDAGVQAALSNTVWLQADVTANDAIDKVLLERFGVFGPPTIIFFGTDGMQRHGYEVVGYMKAGAFTEHVQRALAETDNMRARQD